METFLFIALCFSGIFSFAFGMAWFLPLVSGRSAVPEKTSWPTALVPLGDLVLILFDCVPFFWLIPTSSATRQEIRRLWREEENIRSSFFSFLLTLIISLVLIILLIALNP